MYLSVDLYKGVFFPFCWTGNPVFVTYLLQSLNISPFRISSRVGSYTSSIYSFNPTFRIYTIRSCSRYFRITCFSSYIFKAARFCTRLEKLSRVISSSFPSAWQTTLESLLPSESIVPSPNKVPGPKLTSSKVFGLFPSYGKVFVILNSPSTTTYIFSGFEPCVKTI